METCVSQERHEPLSCLGPARSIVAPGRRARQAGSQPLRALGYRDGRPALIPVEEMLAGVVVLEEIGCQPDGGQPLDEEHQPGEAERRQGRIVE